MTTVAERIARAYPLQSFVFPTTKSEALRRLDLLRSIISSMEEFSAFPEGATGVIVYALLKHAADISPDVGDLNYQFQGMETVLKAAFEELRGGIMR